MAVLYVRDTNRSAESLPSHTPQAAKNYYAHERERRRFRNRCCVDNAVDADDEVIGVAEQINSIGISKAAIGHSSQREHEIIIRAIDCKVGVL